MISGRRNTTMDREIRFDVEIPVNTEQGQKEPLADTADVYTRLLKVPFWEIIFSKAKMLKSLEILGTKYDFIDVVGGHMLLSGNSHDEKWEDEYYLKDAKYKEAFDIDSKMKAFKNLYQGWGCAELIIKEEINAHWLEEYHFLDEYYFRVKNKYFTLGESDWNMYAADRHFPEREDPDIMTVLNLVEGLDMKCNLYHDIEVDPKDSLGLDLEKKVRQFNPPPEELEIIYAHCDSFLSRRGLLDVFPQSY